MSTRTPEAVRQYADAVINALADDFPDLRNPMIASIIRGHIYRHAETGDRMEVILDNPYIANWRLVRDPEHPRRVRVGCWRQRPLNDRYREREERLNEALRTIPMEADR